MTQESSQELSQEFSRILDTDKLLQKAKPMMLEASVDECTAIAKRLGLQSLDAMVATVTVTLPTAIQKLTRLDVALKAQLTQACVVSLKPVAETLEEEFALWLNKGPEPEMTLSEDDYLDLANEEAETVYLNGETSLEMGEILVQYLSLALNPYPRHPDEAFDPSKHGDAPENPFDALKDLTKK